MVVCLKPWFSKESVGVLEFTEMKTVVDSQKICSGYMQMCKCAKSISLVDNSIDYAKINYLLCLH